MLLTLTTPCYRFLKDRVGHCVDAVLGCLVTPSLFVVFLSLYFKRALLALESGLALRAGNRGSFCLLFFFKGSGHLKPLARAVHCVGKGEVLRFGRYLRGCVFFFFRLFPHIHLSERLQQRPQP